MVKKNPTSRKATRGKAKSSPTWLIILLSAIIIFLALLITGVKNKRVINSLSGRIKELESQLEQAEREKEDKIKEFDKFKEKIEDINSTPSVEPSAESTNSAIISPQISSPSGQVD